MTHRSSGIATVAALFMAAANQSEAEAGATKARAALAMSLALPPTTDNESETA